MKILDRFSTELLSEKLEPAGFKRRGNAWFKAVPDVLLCVQIRKMPMKAFTLEYGIVPCVCAYPMRYWLTPFQCDSTFNRLYPEEVKKTHERLFGRVSHPMNHSYTICCLETDLKDTKKYSVLLDYWNQVFDKTVSPFIYEVYDLESALKAIGDFAEFDFSEDPETHEIVHKRFVPPMYMPAFMKLGKIMEAMNYWKPFLKARKVVDIEQEAREALEQGHYECQSLWYYSMSNNNAETIYNIVKYLESEGIKWLKSERLPIVLCQGDGSLDTLCHRDGSADTVDCT